MLFQLYPSSSDVNEDIPHSKRILHDGNFDSIQQMSNNHSDLLNPDKSAGTGTILFCTLIPPRSEKEINTQSKAAVVKTISISFISIMVVGRNKENSNRYMSFWYGVNSDRGLYFVGCSVAQWFFFHHDGVGEETLWSESLVITLRCDGKYSENKIFIVYFSWTLIIIRSYDEKTYITSSFYIDFINKYHCFKECIKYMKNADTHNKNDPEFNVQYYIGLLSRGKFLWFIPGKAIFQVLILR